MGSSAEIDQISASICRCKPILGDFALDELLFEWVISKKLQCFGLGE
jgi:hypothetical protein